MQLFLTSKLKFIQKILLKMIIIFEQQTKLSKSLKTLKL